MIIEDIAKSLDIRKEQVEKTLELLGQENTIPFIARYRKEVTGSLDEEQIKQISDIYQYQKNLLERKEDVIRLIDEKGLLTDELKENILNATKLVEIEDLYRPFKEKKKTKATEAIKLGLEPLAKIIMSFPTKGDIDSICSKFLNENVKDSSFAIEQACYIISEWISDNAFYRKYIRNYIYKEGIIITKVKKDAPDEDKIYEMYYEYNCKLTKIKPYNYLAINRAEKEKVINAKLDYNIDYIKDYLNKKIIKNKNSFVATYVENAIDDSLKRLILPSVEREVRTQLKEKAETEAIENFSINLENLLMQPPIVGKTVLGYDPAYRTGCKLAVLTPTGKPLEIAVIYPTPPHSKIEESEKIVLDLIKKYNIDLVAIGNGTASRESEKFISDCIKKADRHVDYVMVNEAGASVYSASELAINEFPDLTVEKRSAISIGRRLQDSLSELVKIDPKSIGVGLYQHDMPQKELNDKLTFIVEKCVNEVGVNVNSASVSLLTYVSGLTKKTINDIIELRDKLGKITSREEIKNIKSVTPKIYEQSIGFLRVIDGNNPLDKTSIHPENYNKTLELLKNNNLELSDIGTEKLNNTLKNINIENISKELNIGKETLEDIIDNLCKPTRDPREDMPPIVLRQDILTIDDLKVGEKLKGTIRNVVDFGLFIDIGLHDDALAHISKLSNEFVKDPKELFSVGQIVDCYIDSVDKDKNKVSLSLIER